MTSSSQRTKFRLVSVDDLDSEEAETLAGDFVGRKIAGRYTIQAHLGGGGMADVFRANDDELGIDVAIKLLKPGMAGMASDEMRARMVQEAQAAAQVRHPNLVRVFGTGKLDNTAYIAMELLDGPNLETYLRARPGERLPWNEALELLLPALEALHAVHERGYVHRDIKPGNILVAREPGCSPRAVVIDLGLVKPDRALRNAASPPPTEVGRVLCTPGYASPEQVTERPVDRRSDVYSMAITLYRVLAGRLPFHEARGKPIYVVFAHHVHHDPTLLAVAAADVDIPPAIATVIESALAKDPADRPQTMLAFAEALQAAATASTPVPRSPFHRWPYGLVLAQFVVVLSTWLMARDLRVDNRAPVHRSVEKKPAADPPAPSVPASPSAPPPLESTAPPSPTQPTSPPAAGATPEPQPPRRLDAAAREALARRGPAVQACAEKTTTGSIKRLAVDVNIDISGRVSAHVHDAVDTPLSRCIDQALQQTTLSPPRRPLSFVHVYKLRATSRRP
jgi:serine/threonine protein kinase